VLDVIDSRVTNFTEKPPISYSVSMGIYGSRSATSSATRRPSLRVRRAHARPDRARHPARSYAFDGFWLDIGRPDDYDRANSEFDILGHGCFRACGDHVPAAWRQRVPRSQVHAAIEQSADAPTLIAVSRRPPRQRMPPLGSWAQMDLVGASVRDFVLLLEKSRPDAVINCVGATSGSWHQLEAANTSVVDKLSRPSP